MKKAIKKNKPKNTLIKKKRVNNTLKVKKVTKTKPKLSEKKTTKNVKSLKKKTGKKIKSKTIPRNLKNVKLRYTIKELQYFKEVLVNERTAILESAKANMRSLVDEESGDYVGDNLTYATHMAEQGTDEMEREKNYLFVQRDEKYLGYIQEALTRIDQGIYGVCTDCIDEPKFLCNTCPLIPKERLELVPITQHCIECKNIRG
jgi:DnaK suppressor protein